MCVADRKGAIGIAKSREFITWLIRHTCDFDTAGEFVRAKNKMLSFSRSGKAIEAREHGDR
jgi:hypothetical protein